jgi:hypothetical protein
MWSSSSAIGRSGVLVAHQVIRLADARRPPVARPHVHQVLAGRTGRVHRRQVHTPVPAGTVTWSSATSRNAPFTRSG